MKCGTAGSTDGVGQVGNACGGNACERGSALDRVRCREVEQGVQPFDTGIGVIPIAQCVQQGQQQENIRAWTDSDMLAPALRAFGVARVDPDDFTTAPLQAVKDGAPPFQVHKTRLADRGICP
jgi:hypothetical protein